MTMARNITGQPMKFSQFYYSLLMGFSGLVIGTTIGWNSVSHRLAAATTPDGELNDDRWQSLGIYCVGAALGGLMYGQVSRCFGYRLTVAMCDLFAALGWLLFCSFDTLDIEKQETLAVGRFVQGLAAGGLGLIVPIYISHIVSFELRGRMLIFHQLFIIFGVLFSYAFALITTYPIMIGVCAAWPIFHMLVTFYLMPESPYFMYKLNYDRDEVEKMMCLVKGQNYDVASDYNDMQEYMERANKKCVAGKKGRQHHMWIAGIGLMAFQQLCGANTLIFHANEIFDEFIAADVYSGKAQALTIIMLIAQLLLCVIAVELVEFLGRKYMLIVSAVGMCLCLFALVVYHEFVVQDCNVKPDMISVTLVVIYAEFYTIGWGTVVMTVYSEIMHFDKWLSIVVYVAGQCLMLITVYVCFDAGDLVGNTYALCTYGTACGLSVPFVLHFVPETRALPLSRIQSTFLGPGSCDTQLREVVVSK